MRFSKWMRYFSVTPCETPYETTCFMHIPALFYWSMCPEIRKNEPQQVHLH